MREAPRELLNEYDWGGYLIWHVPPRPVFVDGRLFLFLPDVLEDWRRLVLAESGYEAILARHGVNSVLLRPERPLVRALRQAGWRVALEDEVAVLLIAPR